MSVVSSPPRFSGESSRVPGLVALTVLSALVVGLIGTILLISGLVG